MRPQRSAKRTPGSHWKPLEATGISRNHRESPHISNAIHIHHLWKIPPPPCKGLLDFPHTLVGCFCFGISGWQDWLLKRKNQTSKYLQCAHWLLGCQFSQLAWTSLMISYDILWLWILITIIGMARNIMNDGYSPGPWAADFSPARGKSIHHFNWLNYHWWFQTVLNIPNIFVPGWVGWVSRIFG